MFNKLNTLKEIEQIYESLLTINKAVISRKKNHKKKFDSVLCFKEIVTI